jgi:hypothetical protein
MNARFAAVMAGLAIAGSISVDSHAQQRQQQQTTSEYNGGPTNYSQDRGLEREANRVQLEEQGRRTHQLELKPAPQDSDLFRQNRDAIRRQQERGNVGGSGSSAR